ncbi:P pilus assembly protein, pilin FimA [Serratia rhizosphaerae]|uniref:P pilus assembly protein, pilin FimA n=1 Tax=Serratia rhizosphaerae TaxID=2597702 RepID=A0ABX6GUM4_9GAMM|nr:P pilus assembly protein, pilin FimA [Serratia rhizosphaerae]
MAPLLLVGKAQAFTCRTSDGGYILPGGSTAPVDVRVRIGPQLSYGKNEIVNVSQVTCKNDTASWIDYLKTDSPALTMNNAIFGGISNGTTINGADYNSPVPAGISVMELTNLNQQTVNIRVYIVLSRFPTPDIKINKGDIIGQINFRQTNDRPNCPKCGPYRWRLIADNDAYFVTTSCTINNGQQINVDFNQIRQDFLTQNVTDAQIKQDKAISYQCDDHSATQDVLIRLVSDATGFSPDFIKTSNANVGVAMVYKDAVIKPNNAFRTRIVNGMGSDTLTFVPVKNNVPYTSIATGPLSGSATLIFSAP